MHTIYHKTKKLMLAAALAVTAVSCSKSFLEVKPKGRVIASKTSDYDLLLNNLELININADGHIPMGDEIATIEPNWTGATVRNKALFQWQADLYKVDEDAKETLVPMRGLYVYNKIIAEVMEATDGSEAVKLSLQAEAYAGRAWTYFQLIQFYGMPYNPATAATDKGFPLVVKADVNEMDFRRASVQQVYDLIISDLTIAIKNLQSEGVAHRIRMSKAAAQGLLGKVYMFMGRHQEALPLLNESISNLPKSAVPTVVVDYNTAYPAAPTAPNDQENVYAKNIFNNYSSSSNRFAWLTPEAAALYTPGDVRLNRWFTTLNLANGSKLIRRSAHLTAYWGLRTSELYLLRAEVKARLNDLDGAVEDLEYFRSRRMPAAEAKVPDAAKAASLPLVKFVLDERIREFCVWGYRWFDMRRLSVDPLFQGATYQHRVYNEDGSLKETFTLDAPNRWVFRIPPKILAENPNMQNND